MRDRNRDRDTIIAREFRRLRKRIDEQDRRLRAMNLTGTVRQVKGDRVQLELEPMNEKTGKPFLSPWVRWQEAAGDGGGGFTSHVPPAIGEHMMLHSPSGEVGEASLAVRGAYTKDNPDPSGKTDELKIQRGDKTFVMNNDGVQMTAGGTVVALTPDALTLTSGKISTDGATHLDGGTRQVHYVGGKDTDDDAAVDGASRVFV